MSRRLDNEKQCKSQDKHRENESDEEERIDD